jgi:maltooligosyltrehalose synthase
VPALSALYRSYIGDEGQKASSQRKSNVTDIQVERNREHDALERNVTAVARKMNRGDEENTREHRRKMEKNVTLMTRIRLSGRVV